MPPKKKRKRPGLRPEQIFDAAIQLADEKGLRAVSMRKVAQTLGVEAMSLYHHVANKHAMLDGMMDRLMVEVSLPSSDQGWREGMRLRARSMRQVLTQHPWAIALVDARTPGLATLRHHNAVLGLLRSEGFSIPMAIRAFSLTDSYIYGYSLQEENVPFEGEKDMEEIGEALLAQLPADEFPHLAEVTVYTLQSGYSMEEEFELGLEMVLDAIEARRLLP